MQMRIQEFWLGSTWIFLQGIGFGGHLKAPMGKGQCPGGGAEGAKPQKLVNLSDFRGKI